jgi:hypothetical protein
MRKNMNIAYGRTITASVTRLEYVRKELLAKEREAAKKRALKLTPKAKDSHVKRLSCS